MEYLGGKQLLFALAEYIFGPLPIFFGVMEMPINSMELSSLDFSFSNAATRPPSANDSMHPSVDNEMIARSTPSRFQSYTTSLSIVVTHLHIYP